MNLEVDRDRLIGGDRRARDDFRSGAASCNANCFFADGSQSARMAHCSLRKSWIDGAAGCDWKYFCAVERFRAQRSGGRNRFPHRRDSQRRKISTALLGVLGGLEAIRSLQRSGFRPKHSIELLMFTSEEPTRFGIGCLGSRMLSGTMTPDAARKLVDKEGASLEEVRRNAGYNAPLEEVKLQSGYYKAFVELHIEQGPLLEQQENSARYCYQTSRLRQVCAFRSKARADTRVRCSCPIAETHCALRSELILAIENAARTSGAVDTVATVGICDVFPGAVNSIPSRVQFDPRHSRYKSCAARCGDA